MTKNRKKSRSSSKSASKKGCNFAYLIQRKGLRMMRRYYKERFEVCGVFTNYKQDIRSCTVEELNHAIRTFIKFEFPYLGEYPLYSENNDLEETLKTLILSDRYNKKEAITEGLDFESVRKVLYNFNTRNLLKFFSEKSYAFLYYNYCDKQGKQDAIEQTDVEPEQLLNEMQELYKEAEKYVKISIDNYVRDCLQEEPQQSECLMYPYEDESMFDSHI